MDASPPRARDGVVRVPLALVRPTMTLARPVLDREGRVAAGSGTALGERVVQVLRRLAIQSVPVVANDDLAEWERLPDAAAARSEIAARFEREPESEPMKVLRGAVERCFERRARGAEEVS
jgi:hypothetical protein